MCGRPIQTKGALRLGKQSYILEIENVSAASQDALHLIEMLRNGNEDAFIFLIDRYRTTMLRLAMIYVPEHAVAEEVVQEAWLGVLQGLNPQPAYCHHAA